MKAAELIRAAILEDMPTGDLTTESLGLAPQWGVARVMAKSDLILSGSYIFDQTVLAIEPCAQFSWHFEDGQKILSGQTMCTLQGDLLQILKAERIALNFLMRFCGIATLTSRFVEQVRGTKTKILDTRKTLPAYREFEKKAVVHGGGQNHRSSLSTTILIKNNHQKMMGGVGKAIERTRLYSNAFTIVEAHSLEDVNVCVEHKVNRILLDNFKNDQITAALKIVPADIQTEASGNMTVDRVKSVAELGVDFISVGALTHSAPASDVSLQFEWSKKH